MALDKVVDKICCKYPYLYEYRTELLNGLIRISDESNNKKKRLVLLKGKRQTSDNNYDQVARVNQFMADANKLINTAQYLTTEDMRIISDKNPFMESWLTQTFCQPPLNETNNQYGEVTSADLQIYIIAALELMLNNLGLPMRQKEGKNNPTFDLLQAVFNGIGFKSEESDSNYNAVNAMKNYYITDDKINGFYDKAIKPLVDDDVKLIAKHKVIRDTRLFHQSNINRR